MFGARWKRALISAFIIFNAAAIACGSYLPPQQQGVLSKVFFPYLLWTRLLQSWQLFTPTPLQYSRNYRAEIIFRDGQKVTWRRPYPPNWDFFPRHLAYHFQKWDLASNSLEKPIVGKLLWADLGEYLTNAYWNDSNPPQRILFIRAQGDIPPPHPSGYVGLEHEPSDLQWKDTLLFTFSVPERKLR